MNLKHELEPLSEIKIVQIRKTWEVNKQRVFDSVVFEKAWNWRCLRVAGVNTQDLADAHHDVLIKAVTKIHQLRHPNAFKTWFRRVLKSQAKEYRVCYTNSRWQQKRERPKQIDTKSVLIDGQQQMVRVFAPYVPQDQPTARQRLFETLSDPALTKRCKSSCPNYPSSIDVQGAIARLPERWKLAVELFHFEGHSGAEAARALGCNTKRLRKILQKARQRLRLLLPDYAGKSIVIPHTHKTHRGCKPAVRASDPAPESGNATDLPLGAGRFEVNTIPATPERPIYLSGGLGG
jgi:RNA polymerase sigma factor (sigma-70 family)